MPAHSETKNLPYSAEQMYELVADVSSYPQFLPWTAAARVRSIQEEADHQLMLADLVISFKVFRERFGSKVTLWPKHRIDTEYIDGPFKYLRSKWQFEPAGPSQEGCLVHFEVDFEFRNAILQGAAGLFFNEAMSRVVAAFEARAGVLYGDKRPDSGR